MRLTLMNPMSLAAPAGPYSHLVQVPAGAGLIFVSGQVPVGLDGCLGASLAEQADQVYANVVTALASVDTPPSSIIKLTTFTVEDDRAHLRFVKLFAGLLLVFMEERAACCGR
jgi:2-iminobutanoate/2-iminopropanoate deaminase